MSGLKGCASISLGLLCCLSLCAWARAQPVLTVLADVHPPFLLAAKGGLTGPYADTLRMLLQARGISVNYRNVPMKRAFLLVAAENNTCAIDVNFDQGESERVNYVGVIAPVTLSVYTRQGMKLSTQSVDAVRGHTVGAINTAEVRDLLGSAGIPFVPVEKNALGFLMLNAGRFDVFVSDSTPTRSAGHKTPQLAFVWARVERWMICNANVAPALLAQIRPALREGLIPVAAQAIWSRYGLLNEYQKIRDNWIKTH